MIFCCHVTRLVLYTDMPVVAAGLTSAVEGGDFELVSVCATLPELRQAMAFTEPQIVILDFTAEFGAAVLGDLGPLLLTRRVVLLVYEMTREMALLAFSLGIRGIFRSTLPSELVIRCLEKVGQGEMWVEKAITEDAPEMRRTALTGRERQLVRLLGLGLKNREIAEALAITEGTVKVYLSRLFQKLGVKDRFELALYGMKNSGAPVLLPPSLRARTGRRAE